MSTTRESLFAGILALPWRFLRFTVCLVVVLSLYRECGPGDEHPESFGRTVGEIHRLFLRGYEAGFNDLTAKPGAEPEGERDE